MLCTSSLLISATIIAIKEGVVY
jgi:hypothetical protein